MKTISICIGSACHVKGSYEVIEVLKKLIVEQSLQSELEITAAFCLKNCVDAVSVKRWDGKVLSVSRENVSQIFQDEIVAYL
ncbi:(2Fe-2S) ferredoxin domain-containing protein [Niameybacter massiliensis]|uniref:(2Fe-2S) ferredoxin domain-containing protein n=1 Tax=Holtiella tumoricola TaxID=3018743 RepID=A0AA42J3H0_9FIRM|nr:MULTISPECIES: (2Fe-2S) ferredoxin domain-containing protein [Lachnospirales]MDA3734195.1 (2Fe-2S) ferredoxin domain-containing protein [Holtiella tumoricola]